MNKLFQETPLALLATAGIILVLTILVLLEKTYASQLLKWGEAMPTLTAGVISLLKILMPLTLLLLVLNERPGSLGWHQVPSWQAVWKGILLTVVMMAFIFSYQRYSHLLFGTPYVMTAMKTMPAKITGVVFVFGAFSALANAVGEEIIFRGMLLPVLRCRIGVTAALVLSSLIFTMYHFFPMQNAVLLFCMGIFFGLGYLWSGSLLTPILAHLLLNGTGVVSMTVKFLKAA